MADIILAIGIHLIVPLAGLIIYLKLLERMRAEKIAEPPVIELFLIFATYGGLLLLVLTSLFWKWSGMASLGSAFLILGAPILMGGIALRNYKKQNQSNYHQYTYKAGIGYFLIAPFVIIILTLLD